MLVHLSKTSPYVCDLSRGQIEPVNRMASTPSRKALVLLEQKESLSKQTRTPLKLLAHDEMVAETTTHDIDASLQPVWYTEQTIVDEQPKEDIPSIIEEEEESELPPQPSLMHKSSTFTIERLNDSEKENQIQDNPTPSDDSFRALEHLLGLGSATTVRDSPKNNHDTLSLTVVTPTDIINATTNSARASFAPDVTKSAIPPMSTIESMDSTMLPSFLAENTVMEDVEQPVIEDDTDFSFELNDFGNESKDESMTAAPPVPIEEPTPKIRAPTCADVAFRALIKRRPGGRVSQPIKIHSPLANEKARLSAPTSRLLRSSCRRASTETSSPIPDSTTTTECLINQSVSSPKHSLVQVQTLPEEDEETPVDSTNSITLNLTALNEATSTPTKPPMPSLLSREYTYNSPESRRSPRRTRSILNQSPGIASKSILGVLLTEDVKETSTMTLVPPSPGIASKSLLGVLLTEDVKERSTMEPVPSPAIPSQSMLGVLLTEDVKEQAIATPVPSSPGIASSSLLGVLLTEEVKEQSIVTAVPPSPGIASKSLLGVLLTEEPKETSIIDVLSPKITRQSERLSLRPTLQMVSIGEEEQVSVIVPRTMEIGIQTTPSLNNSSRRQMITMEQQTTPVQTKAVIHLQRNVRFELTPTTDARLAEKERQEEKLRGLKPDLVFPLVPVQPVVPAAPPKAKKTSQPKKKVPSKTKQRKVSKSPMKSDGPRTRSRSATKTIETTTPAPVVVRKNKRTLPSVERPIELSEDERKKIEGLTVAGLKTRLATHEATIPKGAKKADLLALLISIETKLLETPKKVEIVVEPPAAKRTRRQKK